MSKRAEIFKDFVDGEWVFTTIARLETYREAREYLLDQGGLHRDRGLLLCHITPAALEAERAVWAANELEEAK